MLSVFRGGSTARLVVGRVERRGLTTGNSAASHHARARTNLRFLLKASPSGDARAESAPFRPVGCICGLGVRARAMLDCRSPHPRASHMQLQLTAVFRKVPEGYVAFVEELPGANTQGATLEEA